MPLKEDWTNRVMKELKKHAERDQCYGCIQLLKELAEAYGTTYEKAFKKG